MHSYQVTAFGQPLVKTTRDNPVPQGREVLVRIGACGVCHSDVHLHDGYFDLGGGKKVDMTRGVQPPRTLGHEIVGEVVALGPGITAADKLSLGARRVVYPWIGCGKCAVCQRGQEQDCSAPRAHGVNTDGGYADHVLVPDAKYLFEYGTLSEEQACTYACSGLTAFGALKKAKGLVGPGPGNDLLIIGAGGVGISGIRMAKPVLGVAPIVADIDPSKFEAARQAGAREVIDFAFARYAAQLAEIHGRRRSGRDRLCRRGGFVRIRHERAAPWRQADRRRLVRRRDHVLTRHRSF